jgi:NAD(P)-dependent dehydrogenase (short-subunit alcohol dehydrogenase family)
LEDDMDIRGLSVLVTGASRGLGAALVQELARRGAKVAAVARSEAELARVVEAANGEGGQAHAIVADVADKDATYAISGSAAALVGPVDVVVHNASTLGPVPLAPLLDTDCEDLERALAVNVVGPFRLTKALAGSMAVRGGGLVVHVTSDAAVEAYPAWGAYGASKAAFDHLTRVWAEELRPFGVRFLSVDPGEMDTLMHADAVPDADRSTLAKPADVARRIAEIVATASLRPTGSRIAAGSVEVAGRSDTGDNSAPRRAEVAGGTGTGDNSAPRRAEVEVAS